MARRNDGSFVIIFKNDKRDEVFLVFRSDFPIWGLTGGGIEKNETPKMAAMRESLKESGFKIRITQKIGCYEFRNSNTNEVRNLSYFFEGRVVSGTFKPEFPGCKGTWFPINKLPINMTTGSKQKIRDVVNFNGNKIYKIITEKFFLENLHLFLLHPISAIKFFRYRSKTR